MAHRLIKNQHGFKTVNTQQQYSFADVHKIKRFQEGVLKYWGASDRKNLPWRLTSDPWRILLAEILLRKTTAVQVARIYETIARLSFKQIREMRSDDLEALLLPMGMYRVRARQIHAIAEVLASKKRQAFKSPEFLQNLPGVGRYARNAVMCFAFNLPKPALDTNMIRLINRVCGIDSNRSRAHEDKHLWDFAETLVPKDKCREFNWGVLDLANAVCKPRSPQCFSCSLQDICDYWNSIDSNSSDLKKQSGSLKQSSEVNV